MDETTGRGLRRYSDDEVRSILERASRARTHRSPVPADRGMTLPELEEVAAEAGIEVGSLRQAALELDSERALRPAGAVERLAGAPFRGVADRVLPFEIGDDALSRLVDSVSGATDAIGEARLIGRTLTWTSESNSGRRQEIRVTVGAGQTTVRVQERYGELAGGIFGGTIGGFGGGAGIGGGAAVASATGITALGFAIPVALTAGAYAACRAGYRAYVRRRAVRLGEICDRIAEDIRAAARSE